MQEKPFEKIYVALSASQELIEKSSFDSINQHDKVAALVSELMVCINHMTMKLEMMNEQIEEMKDQQGNYALEENKFLELTKMLEEQNSLQAEVNQRLQSIMEEQSVESDVIHEMEMQIAEQREIIDEACYIET